MICYGGYPWDVFPFLKKNGGEVNEGGGIGRRGKKETAVGFTREENKTNKTVES